MFCPKCGTPAAPDTKFCPKCGTAVQPDPIIYSPYPPAIPQRYNVFCILGFVVSLISQLINLWGLIGIAGIVLSIVGLSGSQQKNEKGRGLAIAGIVFGVFSVLYATYIILRAISLGF